MVLVFMTVTLRLVTQCLWPWFIFGSVEDREKNKKKYENGKEKFRKYWKKILKKREKI